MPTTRHRIVITETDPVARALAVAARRWPKDADRPSALLLRLVEEGRKAVERGDVRTATRRRGAIRRTAGASTGSYGPGYLEELREDWPE